VAGIWHRDFLMAAAVFRDRGFSTPVSRSRDGDLVTDLLKRLGYTPPPRGSSSKGGAVALRGLLRLVQGGCSIAIPIDGPRGPARRAKIGIVSLSRLSQVPITPVSFSASPCHRFGSWDASVLPLPFARVSCRFGEPLEISRDADPDRELALCRELESRLNAASDELDARYGIGPIPRQVDDGA
jgi:lysophospholipid acyltransferase (LPLAT)-like uncharacterized protein